MKKKLTQILSLLLATQAVLAGSIWGTPSLVYAEKNDAVNSSSEEPSAEEFYGYMPLEEENEPIPALKEDTPATLEDDIPLLGSTALPSYYVNDKLPTPHEQGSYNTCWAIASVELGEIGLGKLSTKSAIDLDYSEIQLAYFSYHDVTDPLGGTEGDVNKNTSETKNYLAVGGNMLFSKNILTAWKGASDETVAPYSQVSSYSSGSKVPEDSQCYNDAAHLQGVRIADVVNNRDEVKALIMEYGAVAASTYESSSYYNSSTYGYYCDVLKGSNGTKASQNHAITLVGWDDSYSASNFKTEPEGDGAWRVMNSWGPSSRDKGFYWISYYDANFSNTAYAFLFEDASNYDNNYQYDGGMYSLQVSYSVSDYVQMSNIFVATSGAIQEQLRAVGFETYATNQKYKVEIYKNLTGRDDPTAGTLCEEATVTGETDYRGYYTVTLPSSVTLDAGEIYSVVVTVYANNGTAYTPFEADTSGSWYQSDAAIATGQSFVKKGASGTWKDQYGVTVSSSTKTYSLGNIRLKAYTDNSDGGAYTIKFNGGDNSAVTGEMADLSVSIDATRALPLNKFELANYDFAGWKSESGTIYSDGQTIKGLAESGSAITLTATWQPTVYTIEYNNIDMEDVYDPGNPTTYTAQISDITLKEPRRSGYTFCGWYEDEEFSTSAKISKIITSNGGNYILYAKWIRDISGVDDAPMMLVDMTNRPTFVIKRSDGEKGLKINLEYGYSPVDTSTWEPLDAEVISGMADDEIYFYECDGMLYAAIAEGVGEEELPNGTYRFKVRMVTLRHLSELVLMDSVPVTVVFTD